MYHITLPPPKYHRQQYHPLNVFFFSFSFFHFFSWIHFEGSIKNKYHYFVANNFLVIETTPSSPPLTTNVPAKIDNDIRKPLIHFLALGPRKWDDLVVAFTDENELKNMISKVATMKPTGPGLPVKYHLKKQLWSEVDNLWKDYTDEQRIEVKKQRQSSMFPLPLYISFFLFIYLSIFLFILHFF